MELKEKKVLSFIRRAEVVASNSPDQETKVGAVLVSKKTGSVVSEGYNGFVRGARDSAIPKKRPHKYEFMIHAEANLICNAARNGVSTDDCFVVQTHSPCVHCARLLHQCGIDTVFYKNYHPGSNAIKTLGDLELQYTSYGKYTRILIRPTKVTRLVNNLWQQFKKMKS